MSAYLRVIELRTLLEAVDYRRRSIVRELNEEIVENVDRVKAQQKLRLLDGIADKLRGAL